MPRKRSKVPGQNKSSKSFNLMKSESACPVLEPKMAVSTEPVKSLKRILAPVDFSDCSRLAIRYAASQAKQVDGEVTLLTVIPDYHPALEYGEAEAIASLENRAKNLKRDLANLAGEMLDGIRHQVLVKVGRPFEEIVRSANDLESDLIVISTHGYPGETRVDLGSTAERVIRYAICPVLVVRCLK